MFKGLSLMMSRLHKGDEDMLLNRFILFMAGLALGFAFMEMHLPIPFLLGGMIASLGIKSFDRDNRFTWPVRWREYGLLVGGYGIGSNFDQRALANIVDEFPGVIGATALIMSISVALAFATSKFAHEDKKTCILGMLPGGMTMAMLMADEDKDVNPNAIVVMQVLRMFMVVVTVPFLVVFLLHADLQQGTAFAARTGGIHWGIFLPSSLVGYYAAKYLKIPTPGLMGPIIMAALVSLAFGDLQMVPEWLMMCAQVSIGSYIGMMLDIRKMMTTAKLLPYIIGGTLSMIGVSIFVGMLLSSYYSFDLITAFLAMAPGGITEMSLAGLSVGANVAVILTYQLFRVLTINVMGPILANKC